MGNEHFLDLFRYNDWANQKVLDALASLERVETAGAPRAERAAFEEALTLLSHLLRAQEVWLGRVEASEAAHLPIWPRDALAACTRRSAENTRAWLGYLQACTPDDFDRPVAYTNSKGQPFRSTFRQIATHVVNHSTHHRAQIVRLIREAGAAPPVTDYIFYARS